MIFLVFLTVISATASQSALRDQVRFFLYTPSHQNTSIEVGPNNVSKYLEPFEMKIIIHGWLFSSNDPALVELRRVFFERGKFNIIAVDYSRIQAVNIFLPVIKVSQIGEVVGDLIVNIARNGFSLKSIQVIATSLGAHVAGHAGRYVQRTSGQKVELIVGLDPGGPTFEGVPGRSLNATDANNVFVIHTDRFFIGISSSVGTVDVFPNNGTALQPGCSPLAFGCSHGRAVTLFIDAVKYPGRLVAAKCNNYEDLLAGKCNNTARVDLDGQITINDRGEYFSKTTGARPFDTILPPK